MNSHALLLPLIANFALAQDRSSWDRIGQLAPGERLSVQLKKGRVINGRFDRLGTDHLTILKGRRSDSLTFKPAEIERVHALRKASRWKSAGIGALVGFGIGFAIGAPMARNILDRNNPSFKARAGIGAGVGLFGAGIGAAAGALGGGSRRDELYRAP